MPKSIMYFAKVDSKFCLILNKPSNKLPNTLNFYQSGEISPNLVTLITVGAIFWHGIPTSCCSCGSSSSMSSPPSTMTVTTTSARCGVQSPITRDNLNETASPNKARLVCFSGGASPSHPSYRRSLSHTTGQGEATFRLVTSRSAVV